LCDADGEPVGPALPNSVSSHGPRGRQTDQQNEARGSPSRPKASLTPDKQAGYMTATEFQNRVCNSTLARGRGPYMAAGAGWIRTGAPLHQSLSH